ncbi:MAG: hypothetical protein ACE5GQ_07680, partial [Nitrospinales bacterium]
IKPIWKEWEGKGSLVEFVVSMNLYRRHLSIDERTYLAVKALPDLETEARERMTSGANQHSSPSQKIDQPSKGKSTEKAAEIYHTNLREIFHECSTSREYFRKVRPPQMPQNGFFCQG